MHRAIPPWFRPWPWQDCAMASGEFPRRACRVEASIRTHKDSLAQQEEWAITLQDQATGCTTFGSSLKVKAGKRRQYAKTQTREEQLGSLSPWARLHGNELRIWPGC